MVIASVLFLVYFSASMAIKNPFNFPKNENYSVILENYIFENNTSLALLVLTIITVFIIIWDCILIKNLKIFENKLNLLNPLLEKISKYQDYIPWYVL